MIRFKPEVRMQGFLYSPTMIRVLHVADATRPYPEYVVTITSGYDYAVGRRHNTKHMDEQAWDIRTKDITQEQAEKWESYIKRYLGKDYDVLLHGSGNSRHIHAEYDPK